MVENTETGQSQTFDVHEPFVLIGRAEGSHLRLLHSDVSYRHAYCQVIQGRLYVFDLDSTHGIAWSTGLRREGVLTPADRLHIGPFIIRQSRAPAFTRSLVSTSEDWELENEPLENIRLWFENATGRNSGNAMRPLRRQITIMGRANCCHLKLSDSSVSKAHCAIVRTAVGSWIVDLLGRAGTKLNDRETRFAPIDPLDRVRAGRFRMSIRELVEEASEELVHPPTSHEPHPDSEFDLPVADVDAQGEVSRSLSTESEIARDSHESGRPLTVQELPPIPGHQGVPATSDGLILSMMEQFSHLQQQLLAHTEQQMSMLTEMFATLHQAQNEAVLEQLQRIQTITTELNELRAERAVASTDEQRVPASPTAIGNPEMNSAEDVRADNEATDSLSESCQDAVESNKRDTAFESPAIESSRSSSLPGDTDAASGRPHASAKIGTSVTEQVTAPSPTGDFDRRDSGQDSTSSGSSPEDSDVVPAGGSFGGRSAEPGEPESETEVERRKLAVAPKRVDSERPRQPEGKVAHDPETHARLTTRISELERERNSRWKRLMQLVSNMPDE
mgnify:FL=1